jgi:HPt (histidine-containing phosphotransfer) domain-containing protein
MVTLQDIEQLASTARTQGGERTFELLIEAVCLHLPQQLSEVERAVAQRDSNAVKTSAHKIKSSVSYLSKEEVYQVAYRLEQAGGAGNLQEAPTLLLSLKAEVEAICSAVKAYRGRCKV